MSRLPLLPTPFPSVRRDSAVVRLTQRVNAYQPRVQPWEWNDGNGCGAWDGGHGCAPKERRIVRARTFQEEYRDLLTTNVIEYDEPYASA